MVRELRSTGDGILQSITDLAVGQASLALTREDGTVQVIAVADGSKRELAIHFPAGHTSVAFTGVREEMVFCDVQGGIWLYEPATDDKPHFWASITECAFQSSLAVSHDGRFLLVGGSKGRLNILPLRDPDRLRTVSVAAEGETFPADVSLLAFGHEENKALVRCGLDLVLIDVVSGKILRRIELGWHDPLSLASGPGGKQFATGGRDGTVRLWDSQAGLQAGVLTSRAEPVVAATILNSSTSGTILLVGTGKESLDQEAPLGGVHLWDLEKGGEIAPLSPLAGISPAVSQVFSNSSAVVLMHRRDESASMITGPFASYKGTVDLISPAGEVSRSMPLSGGKNLSCSPDGRYCLVVTTVAGKGLAANLSVHLLDLSNGKLGKQLGVVPAIGSVSLGISNDGRTAFVSNPFAGLRIWDIEAGREMAHDTMRSALAFAGEGRRIFVTEGVSVLLGGSPPTVSLFNPDTGTAERSIEVPMGRPERLLPLPGGQEVLLAVGSGLWRAALTTGNLTRMTEGHSSLITDLLLLTDGRHVVSASNDHSLLVWDLASGKWLARLVSFTDGTWVAVDPEGRFDTNNLEEIKGLHWVMPDDPMRPLSLEIFMRDYYEPRLLTRILSGETLQPVKNLATLNRIQPEVTISAIATKEGGATVDVTVDVAAVDETLVQEGKPVNVSSGVRDVRLFRDGQLVGWQDGEAKPGSIVFRDIRLPHRGGKIEFSAYAFNADRVKSLTARQQYLAPTLSQKGRAYLITVGVNASENPSLDLDFAASDAKALRHALEKRVTKVGAYAEVVAISLYSDYRLDGKNRVVTEMAATKARFKAVLDLMAGRSVDSEVVKSIAGADRLHRVTPDDLVVISFASHGYRDKKGNFYLLPFDVGPGKGKKVTKEIIARSISSDELTQWLREIDAGEMVMVVDACHAAASVEGVGFKPGPMGSRGLGQLAYDKGMRILAATQADDVAVESEAIGHGLLSYALVTDGLEAGKADFLPKDNRITMAEALAYAAKRVPELYRELSDSAPGTRKEDGKKTSQPRLVGNVAETRKSAAQQPALFDFSRNRQGVLLVPSLTAQ
jgi:WD40 repeat protein/uncharacterized caspase-like protein